MIHVLAQIIFRQVCTPRSFDEPDLPPARCPVSGQRSSRSRAARSVPAASASREASDAGRWLEPQAQALVDLFTQLAQRRVQAARAQEDL